jgi:hypothetical protein
MSSFKVKIPNEGFGDLVWAVTGESFDHELRTLIAFGESAQEP